MTKDNLRIFFGWCSVINLGILLYWILALIFAHRWVFWVHTWWFEISKESFDKINYTLMVCYKLAVILFNITPYLVLRFIKIVPPTSSGNE
tara:strand:- start:685 stop:957 length:273 start_codon:yes stop_codon:yes gene_type:complete